MADLTASFDWRRGAPPAGTGPAATSRRARRPGGAITARRTMRTGVAAAPVPAGGAPRRQSYRSRAPLAIAAVVTVLAAVVLAVAWQVREGQRLADGPLPIAWEREACAHCLMHLSDPRYAVQLQTTDGAVLNFDDPGCFFLYVDENQPPLHEAWFRDSRAERWLRRGEVGFVAAPATPMDLGLAAVAAGEAGALSYDAARARVAAGRDGRGS